MSHEAVAPAAPTPVPIPTKAPVSNTPTRVVEGVIFNIRWTLIPLYLGLFPVLIIYGGMFFWELFHFAINFIHDLIVVHKVDVEAVKLFGFDSIDAVMVANLINMIPPGSYNSFVSKDHKYKNQNISSGELKIKIATSITILSMVHLLKIFILPSDSYTWDMILKELVIFTAFLIGALILSVIEFIHTRSSH